MIIRKARRLLTPIHLADRRLSREPLLLLLLEAVSRKLHFQSATQRG